MTRMLYDLLLRLHPAPFRARFRDEMMHTFEEAQATEGATRLLLDAFLSLLRQYFLRPHARPKLASQAITGSIQVNPAPPLGLGPLRLFQGGLVSLALFLVVFLSARSGKTLRGTAPQEGHVTIANARPRTPADLLATERAECPKGSPNGCSTGVQWIKNGQADGTLELQYSMARKPNANEFQIPSGPFGVGRVLYEWPQQPDAANGRTNAQSRNVFVWYPSSVSQGANKGVTSVWNYSKVKQVFLQTHTLEKAPIAQWSDLFPVLLFYPAMNSSSAAYTTQIENLVSHGYVVASLEPLPDPSAISFSNTQILPFAADLRKAYKRQSAAPRDSLWQAAIEHALAHEKSLAADLTFVLNALTIANNGPARDAPFSKRLDLSKVGAFGHSDGGTAAALACQLDRRISACLSEDGWTPRGPTPEIASVNTPARPFMWINLPIAPPDNEQLAYLHLARKDFDSMAAKSEILATRQLDSLRNKAYRITLRRPDLTDDYFTDGPFVWSMQDPGENVTARNALVVVNNYMRAFFDHSLRAQPSDLLDGSALPFRNVEVKRYGAALAASTQLP
jgi:predicted dienelactone hydrolase